MSIYGLVQVLYVSGVFKMSIFGLVQVLYVSRVFKMSTYGLVQVFFICFKGFQDVQIWTCSSFI